MRTLSFAVPLVSLISLCACGVCGAQSQATLQAFVKEAHTGPVEQTLVGVTTKFHDKAGQILEERHGSGMVVRCDGFVLFSAAMLDHRADEPDDLRPTIEITLRPGTSQEVKLTVAWPKTIPSGLSMRMVKLDDVHAPALRTLLADCLKQGDPVMVAWLPWDESAHRFGPLQRRSVHYARLPKQTAGASAGEIDEPPNGASSGAVVIGPEGMAVGMLMMRAGEDSRRFVSMEALPRVTNCVVPVPTPDAQFTSHKAGEGPPPPDAEPPRAQANNFGGLAPGQDGAKPDDGGIGEPAPNSKPTMVKVPGGPVILPAAIVETQVEMNHGKIACVPPFQIDKFEVTNQEYWDFWTALPNKTSADAAFRRAAWPAGWAASQVPFPGDIARLPVVGVPSIAAQAYARSVGKRLPTPYEYMLAAFGPSGDAKAPEWLTQYMAETNDTAMRIKKAHIEFLKDHAEIHGEDFLSQGARLHSLVVTHARVGNRIVTINADQRIHGADFMPKVPWIIAPLLGFAPELNGSSGFFDSLNSVAGLEMPIRLKMQLFSKTLIESETQALWDKWKAPQYLLPVGSRSFDISQYGAADMIWNGPELVAPPPSAPGGMNGFAVSVTMLHPQDQPTVDDLLLNTGLNTPGLVDASGAGLGHPLSRLIERSDGFPVAQWLWFQNNLEEVRSAVRLMNGFQVNMLPASSVVNVRVDNHSPFVGQVFYDNFPLYRSWATPSKHTRKEIGNAISLPAGERVPMAMIPRDTGAYLRFVVPIGFRCAR